MSKSRSFSTRFAFIWMQIATEPFIAFYTLLLFILRKDLGATPLQISILATLRPAFSLFSFYWSSNLLRDRSKLLSNFMGAWVLSFLPFLCLPFISNVWFVILSAAIYQLFSRALIPSKMEILKLNLEKEPREKLFSSLYVLSFIESICLGLFVGKLLDLYEGAWQILFALAAVLSLTSTFIQMRIPLPSNLKQDDNILPISANRIIQPIKDTLHLLRTRPDFSRFQWGFMIGGFGLMFMTPAIHIYYADTLNMTHNSLAIARYIWMGVGVVSTTFLWRRGINRLPIHRLTAMIIFGFSLFPVALLFAIQNLFWVNIAFLFYGIAQAGSHLIWNLSGTLFANKEDSSKFSGVNILMVGVRGLVGPVLGGLSCNFFSPLTILMIGIVICLLGAGYSLRSAPEKLALSNIR
ncbi:MAG: MFS transporter [Chlamydiia bacterium]|nr:MFS transporter [Chlamydiia bacterium]